MDIISLQSWFHPLHLFAFQVLATSMVIGLSTSHGFSRVAMLPIIVLCAYGIITTSKNYMRLHWASLLSGTANGFVLQYIELALLSRWSLQSRGTVFGEQNQKGFWDRFRFGLASTFSFRNVNTPWEVKNVPRFAGRPPSSLVFVCRQIVIVIMCMLVVDISSSQPPPSNAAELFSPEKEQFFSRLGDITPGEMVLRITSTFVYWLNMYAIMQGVTSAAAAIAVSSGFSEVSCWRPLFGSPAMAHDLRGFWGIFWHQTLRQILSHPAEFITHEVLMLEGTTARYCRLFLTFAISGILHTFAELGGGIPLETSGTLSFFCLQAGGIMIEDAVKTNLTGKHPRWIGYVWVVSFLVWSTPTWLYPDARSSPKISFLPFTMLYFMQSRKEV